MTATKHTPGPWIVASNGAIEAADHRIIVPPDSIFAWNIPNPAFGRDSGQLLASDDGGEANAHLIASAPKLLETLHAVAELRHKWRSQDEAETIDSIEYMDGLDALDLDAIIAKAEGK